MPALTLEDLAGIVAARAASADAASYTSALARKGVAACARKFGEEAIEALIAAISEDRQALRAEAADVLYHLLVLLHVSGVSFDEVKEELGRRSARSGLEEKASRSSGA